jgi:transcriptional regulator with XRE-family HTH domain
MSESKMLPALLKHYRRARGMSQLDLASAADVSPKHLSFLETGRAKPSREMLLRLGSTLALALRDQNSLLSAAGFAEIYRETEIGHMSPAIRNALERMMSAQEPFPLVVFDANYDVRMLNHGAQTLLLRLLPPTALGGKPANALELCFDPAGLRPHIENWEHVARHMLNRLAREHLQSGRERLGLLLSRLLAYPEVPSDFRELDLTSPVEPVFDVRFRFQDRSFGFLTTITAFTSPQDVTLDELRIESYFPLDAETTRLCEELAGRRPAR